MTVADVIHWIITIQLAILQDSVADESIIRKPPGFFRLAIAAGCV